MTKSDLVDGMEVTYRNGNKRVFSFSEYGFMTPSGGFSMGLSEYTEDLLDKDGEIEYDIVSISQTWRRRSTEEMTLEQVCKELGRDIKIVKGE